MDALVRIETLKKRSEFQRVRGGGRYSHPAFVLEGKKRPESEAGSARFGFTITKKVGNAVTRNRIRRRLKAALSELLAERADNSFDYVVVGRDKAFDHPFEELRAGLGQALDRVNSQKPKSAKPRAGAVTR